mgnify:FL=1
MRVVYISSYKPKILYIMDNKLIQDLRMQAVRSLFDGLTFNQATNTSDWDELTCDEQMRLEDLINS